MVRRMSVYDKNGHRLKAKPAVEEDGEKLELPPISGEGSQRNSASSNGRNSGGKTPTAAQTPDPNAKLLGKDVTGVLYRVRIFIYFLRHIYFINILLMRKIHFTVAVQPIY